MKRQTAMARNFNRIYGTPGGRRSGKYALAAQEAAQILREAPAFCCKFQVRQGWVEIESRCDWDAVEPQVLVTLDRTRGGCRTRLDLSRAEAENLVDQLQRALAHLAVAEVHET